MDHLHFDRANVGTGSDVDKQPGVVLAFWFFFQISAGHVLLPILVATFLFSKAKRDITLVNLCATFIVTGICACLLLYAGQYKGPQPDKVLCMFQAATTNACSPMWGIALLAFVLYMRDAADKTPGKRPTPGWQRIMMIILPYIVFVFFVLLNIIIDAQNPNSVARSSRFLYCSSDNNTLATITAAFSCVLSIVNIGLTIQFGLRLYQSYRYLHRAGVSEGANKLSIRLVIFTVYIFVGLIFSFWTAVGHPDPTPRDMYIGSLGLAIFFIFGTQRDVFRAWCFWRPNSGVDDEDDKTIALSRTSTMEIGKPGRWSALTASTSEPHLTAG
ncbi:hypothetical protein BV25DRAFT_944330 [Artomyces pyxidatus]|uniref:Uncharacterized protein n=1 Tax=Artomyces pyxidatus TaxID=48021 RepID=A0ACB8SXB2_9AGAM|nr:hypothetical protein BV25DRAFT_944330 [Artomyces pyxidatus]